MKPKSQQSLPASAFVTDSRPPQPTVTLIVLSGLPGVGKTTIAPDLDEHKRRVESRVPDIAHHKVPTLPEVMAHDYRPWDNERLVIDTARLTVPKSIQAILSASGLTLTSRQAAD